jgi:hypothetical protein
METAKTNKIERKQQKAMNKKKENNLKMKGNSSIHKK